MACVANRSTSVRNAASPMRKLRTRSSHHMVFFFHLWRGDVHPDELDGLFFRGFPPLRGGLPFPPRGAPPLAGRHPAGARVLDDLAPDDVDHLPTRVMAVSGH